jgi:hypothetical protein
LELEGEMLVFFFLKKNDPNNEPLFLVAVSRAESSELSLVMLTVGEAGLWSLDGGGVAGAVTSAIRSLRVSRYSEEDGLCTLSLDAEALWSEEVDPGVDGVLGVETRSRRGKWAKVSGDEAVEAGESRPGEEDGVPL